MRRLALAEVFLGFASFAVAAGCSGGGGTQTSSVPAAPAAPAAVKLAPATFTIVIPAQTTSSSSGKKPEYVSPATNSVSFFVTGMSATQVVALDGSDCTTSGGTKTCTASFNAPIGVNEMMEVEAFQSSDGSGTPLSLNEVPITIASGATNAITVILNGVVASFGLVLSPTSMTAGTTGDVTAMYTAYDAAGYAIVGPGTLVDSTNAAITPALTANPSGGSTAIGALSNNAWTVTETSPSSGSIVFTVAASGNPTPVSGMATLTINAATPSPSPSPTPFLACNQGAASIVLGSALAPFALLAGSSITNTGDTVVTYGPGAVTSGVNDDLIGVSPGSTVTGFPPGTDTDGSNAIYATGYNTNTAVPLAAENALTTAYDTAAGETATTTFADGTDLSEVSVPGYSTGTLPPGVYSSASSLAITSGNLTLDGGGNPQSVFIFQIGSTLTTTLNGGSGGNVILTNGAGACNIYWQVGSSATLGGATFYGNVLANTAITINATTFTGRALAEGGTVTIPVAGGSLITNPGGQ